MTLLADIGDRATLTATFTTAAGTAVAPTTVALKIMDPSGNLEVDITTGYTTGGTGIYKYDVTLDQAGLWRYRWAGTGAAIASAEGELRVSQSAFV